MGVRLKFYQVQLNDFKRAVGSKDYKLLKQALNYYNIIDFPFAPSEFEKYLHQLIFEANTAIYVQEDQRNLNELDIRLVSHREALTSLAIRAIFSQNSTFKEWGEAPINDYDALFEDLSSHSTLSPAVSALWKYLVDGRLLVQSSSYVWYHTYLYHSEIKQILTSLEFYKSEEGQEHLQRLKHYLQYGSLNDQQRLKYVNISNGLQNLSDIFSSILQQNADFFGIIA